MSHFVLVDCNNFYASCERLFNPRLEGKPVIVLSNNDGCVVARSQEAKQLGIAMGEPFFKIKDLCKQYRVNVFSSNYALYGDLSRRVMSILTEQVPDIQVYSIDEAFLEYPKEVKQQEMIAICRELKAVIKQWVGIPTSLGIGPTKTLAKVANYLAKKNPKYSGVCNLCSTDVQRDVLGDFPVGEVWGIGGRSKVKLQALGIFTAGQFCELDPLVVRKQMGVVGERILWELRGVSCLPLEKAEPRKNIAFSRSFGKVVTEKSELHEAIATYVAAAAVKMRKQSCSAQAMYIYLEEAFNSYTGVLRQHHSMTKTFPFPIQDTPWMIQIAKHCVGKLYCKGMRYKKCGVVLLDLVPDNHIVPDLFQNGVNEKRKAVSKIVDALNATKGKNTLFYAAMGINPAWRTRAEARSHSYTTSWDGLAKVRA